MNSVLNKFQQHVAALLLVTCLVAVPWCTLAVRDILVRRNAPEGLLVTYFRGTHLDAPVCTRGEFALLKDYKMGRPALGVPRDHFSARWEGLLLVPETALYSFYSQSDDGLRMWIGTERVLDNWNHNDWQTSGTHGSCELTVGEHRIVVEHYDESGAAALRIRWAGGSIPPNTVMDQRWLRKPQS